MTVARSPLAVTVSEEPRTAIETIRATLTALAGRTEGGTKAIAAYTRSLKRLRSTAVLIDVRVSLALLALTAVEGVLCRRVGLRWHS